MQEGAGQRRSSMSGSWIGDQICAQRKQDAKTAPGLRVYNPRVNPLPYNTAWTYLAAELCTL